MAWWFWPLVVVTAAGAAWAVWRWRASRQRLQRVHRRLIQRAAGGGGGDSLFQVVAKGEHETLAKLLERPGAQVKERTSDGRTLLHVAVQRAHEESVRLLVAHGADINALDKKRESPLHMACIQTHSSKARDRYWRIAELLLGRGAMVNMRAQHGYTPLYLAVKNGRHDLVKLLIDSGANPNIYDSEGYGPLFWARKMDNQETIRRLEARGAKEFAAAAETGT